MKTMGKRFAALFLALLMVLTVCACSKQEQEASTPDEKEETVQSSGFYVTYQGTKIALGADASLAIAKLGDASSAQEVFDCGVGNSRMYYRYASLDLYTMKNDGKETVDQIELLDDLIETDKGISIGAAEASVREAYGAPTSESEGELTYADGDQRLIIEITDGKVSAIGLLRVTA